MLWLVPDWWGRSDCSRYLHLVLLQLGGCGLAGSGLFALLTLGRDVAVGQVALEQFDDDLRLCPAGLDGIEVESLADFEGDFDDLDVAARDFLLRRLAPGLPASRRAAVVAQVGGQLPPALRLDLNPAETKRAPAGLASPLISPCLVIVRLSLACRS